MRTHLILAIMLAYASPALAVDDASFPAPARDERMKLLPYDEGDVYTILTRYGYQTNIVFDRNESIETLSVGDRSVWQIIPAGHRIFIRPMIEGASTNMTVLTDRRSYQFDLRSLSPKDDKGQNIYVAKFIYPDDRRGPARDVTVMDPIPPVEMARMETPPAPSPPSAVAPPSPALPPVAAPDVQEGPGVTRPVHPNYNYTYSGPDTLAPLQVFDNGQSTFVRYVKLPQPLPDVLLVDGDGRMAPMTPEIRDSMIVIPAIAGTLLLKHAGGDIMIYNELINPNKPE